MIKVDDSEHKFVLSIGRPSEPFYIDKAKTIKFTLDLSTSGVTLLRTDGPDDPHLCLMFHIWFPDKGEYPTDGKHNRRVCVGGVKDLCVGGRYYGTLRPFTSKVKICCQIDAAWKQTHVFIPLKLAATFDEQKFMDCKVQFGRKTVWASKYILTRHSKKFVSELSRQNSKAGKRKKGVHKVKKVAKTGGVATTVELKDPSTVQIEGFDETVVINFLKYLHSDGVIFPEDGHEKLYRIAKHYEIIPLMGRCSNKLCDLVDKNNFAKLLVFAFEEEIEELKCAALLYAHKDDNKGVFVSSQEFKNCAHVNPDVAILIVKGLVGTPPSSSRSPIAIATVNQIAQSRTVPSSCMDLTFKVNRSEVHASKFVLAANSDVFAAMFNSNFKESSSGCVTICDASVSTVRNMVNFLQYGLFPNDGIEELYVLADKYNIVSLTEKCLFEMCKDLNYANFAKRLVLSFQQNLDGLKNFVLNFALNSKYTKQFVHSTEFSELMNCNPPLALEICRALH